MRVVVFSARSYDRHFLDRANRGKHELVYLEPRLDADTAAIAGGGPAVCAFVNDNLDRAVLSALAAQGVRLVVLRSAGYNNVDAFAARELGLQVGYVPAYSPHAVAEHTTALLLALNRKLHRAYSRVREGNFSLDGLLGFDLAGRQVGIIGTGRIGRVFAQIMLGFGCSVLAHDPVVDDELVARGVRYTDLETLLASADIVSLHCPLTPATRHLIDANAVRRMRRGVMLINTSRGAIVETRALIDGLKSGQIGSLALDVYEAEAGLFFEDRSSVGIPDDVFARLLTFPNVLITGHQGFFTEEALTQIATTTIENITAFERSGSVVFPVTTSA